MAAAPASISEDTKTLLETQAVTLTVSESSIKKHIDAHLDEITKHPNYKNMTAGDAVDFLFYQPDSSYVVRPSYSGGHAISYKYCGVYIEHARLRVDPDGEGITLRHVNGSVTSFYSTKDITDQVVKRFFLFREVYPLTPFERLLEACGCGCINPVIPDDQKIQGKKIKERVQKGEVNPPLILNQFAAAVATATAASATAMPVSHNSVDMSLEKMRSALILN